MEGSGNILQLEVQNRLVQRMDPAPNLFFATMFPEVRYDSDSIRWDIEYGSQGLTPFVAPGAPMPKVGLDGVGEGYAKAAYLKEGMDFDEVYLNNLREPGNKAMYMTAERHIARGLRKLRNRLDRRREWLCAKAIIDGVVTYPVYKGTNFTVNYGIPATHKVTLPANRYWDGGANRNPIEDVLEGKRVLSDDAGVVPEYALLNSQLLKVLMLDPNIQALLKKSAFGNGDLFAQPAEVIGSLLNIPLRVYDEVTEHQQRLTAGVTGGATTTIHVADVTDVQVGDTARFVDVSENNVWEDATVSAVNQAAGTFDIAAAPSKSFKAFEDKVIFRSKFIKDNQFVMFSSRNGNGEPIAEVMLSPYGIPRTWGVRVSNKVQWDPEALTIRIEYKGLPVIYSPDCTYSLTVG